MMITGKDKFPFTAAQWQELEHQALVYKYISSGMPVPPDLLLTAKRSCLDSPLSSQLFSRQTSGGWSGFQMGLSRKIDPEPGRCRRTDGKKWRCSKDAYMDSKYCEKHMHRGKNRSRKPVEVVATQTTPPFEPSISRNRHSSLQTRSSNSLTLLLPEDQQCDYTRCPQYHSQIKHPFPAAGRSPQANPAHFLLDSEGSYSLANTDYRRSSSNYGLIKAELDEHAFFKEPSGSMKTLHSSTFDNKGWQLAPLSMSSCSSTSSKQRNLSSSGSVYSYLQLQSDNDLDIIQQQKQYQPSSYNMDSEVKGINFLRDETKEETQKTFHRFFDEWSPKNKETWLDLHDRSSNKASISATKLSISVPSSYDFPIFNSRAHKGN